MTLNPILQTMRQSNLNSIIKAASGNPQALFNQMMQSNPQFASFVNANKGKTAEQIAEENGIDFNLVNTLMRKYK